jgi:hypothetical protein
MRNLQRLGFAAETSINPIAVICLRTFTMNMILLTCVLRCVARKVGCGGEERTLDIWLITEL